jgi:phosphoribosylformimino-5-aminoimidazole carboxamide ribotide isomerase
MQIFPAIDILGGKAVRLRQGRYDQVTVYNEDPVEQARIWAEAGPSGCTWSTSTVRATASRQHRRHREDREQGARAGADRRRHPVDGHARPLYHAGVTRTVLGTSLVTDPEFVAAAPRRTRESSRAGRARRQGRDRRLAPGHRATR